MPRTSTKTTTQQALLAEVADLRARLEEAEETLRAIRSGEVDALIVSDQIYTLESADAASNRFRGDVLTQVNEAIIAVDNDNYVTYLNPAAERLYEVTAADVLGHQLSVVRRNRWLQPADEAAAQAALQETGYWHGETIQIKRSGAAFQVESTISRLRDPNGAPTGQLVVIRDITERKQVEEKLRESEEKYRTLFTSMDEGFCLIEMIFDENDKPYDYRFLTTNPAFERHTGVTNATGRTARAIMPHENHWFEIFGQIALTGEPARFEQTAAALGRWFEVHAYRVGQPAERKVAILFNDITLRKVAAEKIRVSEEHLSAVVNQTVAAIAETDLTGQFTFVNDRYCELAGYTRAELVGKMRMQQLTHPEDLPQNSQDFQRLVETGPPFAIENRYVRKDGSIVWAGNSVSALRDTAGKVQSVIAVMVDITERKRAEADRERLLAEEQCAREAAEAATRAKDEFVALVSHELRNPLNSILGYNRMLQQASVDATTRHQYTAIIETNARRQLTLLEDLLDTARMVSGKLKLNIHPFNFARVIADAVEAARPSAEAKQIVLAANLGRGTADLTGDSDRLQQVVWNLLTNAIKFTPAGGAVIVTLAHEPGHLRLTVTDTGKGIAPAMLPYIFDRFRQADSSSTRRYGGLGLGLALAQQLVELHGGTIEAHSAGEGQGATFTVTLPWRAVPRPEEAALPHPSHPLAPSSRLTGLRILVVDDEAEARELIVDILTTQGAQVTPVSSAAAALQLLTIAVESAPDVLISDISMPDVDGYELLRQVRRQGLTLPAIAVTALGRTEDRLRALTAGFQMHVPKPVEPEELIAVVCSLTHR